MAGFDPPTPRPLRPSELERERVIRSLREHAVAGRLSLDTFAHRVEEALAATSRDHLRALDEDLPPPGVRGWLVDLGSRLRAPRLPKLALSTNERELVLGRSRRCDCVMSDETVSRRHASVRWTGRSWILRDLGSLNGVTVNGWRVVGETEVRPGDRVAFGEATYRLVRAR